MLFNIENELSQQLGSTNILQESQFFEMSEDEYKDFLSVIEKINFSDKYNTTAKEVKETIKNRYKEVSKNSQNYMILNIENIQEEKIDGLKEILDFIGKNYICSCCAEKRNTKKLNDIQHDFLEIHNCSECGNEFFKIKKWNDYIMEILLNKIDNFFQIKNIISYTKTTPQLSQNFLKNGEKGIELISSSYDDFFDEKVSIDELHKEPEIYTIKLHYKTDFGTDLLNIGNNETGKSFVKELQYFIRTEVYDISTNYETGEIFITLSLLKKEIPNKIPYNYLDILGEQLIPVGLNKSTNRGLYFNFNDYDIVGTKMGNRYGIDTPVPHLFVVGGTGSGKSVWINNFLFQTMRQNSPDEIGFVIIDPKRVSYNQYTDSPYLISPIVKEYTNMPKILQGIVDIMDERYKTFEISEKEYNQKIDDIRSYNQNSSKKMKKIFVIFDELAEGLDQQSNKGRSSIEISLKKIGQKARAAGIHLLLITQRASSENIGSEISANIGGRIALKTNSPIDSVFAIRDDRAFYIDRPGMGILYKNNSYSEFMTPFISDKDIKIILKTVKEKGYSQDFNSILINSIQSLNTNEEKKEDISSGINELLPQEGIEF